MPRQQPVGICGQAAVCSVAWIFALGREGQEEVARNVFGVGSGGDGAFEAALFENGEEKLLGRTRVSGGLQNDELTLLQVRVDGEAGVFDVAQIGFAPLVERRRNADDDGVDVLEFREVGRSAEMLAVDVLLNLGLLDVLDVRFAGVEQGNFGGIGIETGDFVAGFGKAKSQGKADGDTRSQ